MNPDKIKAKIQDVVMANKFIQEMKDFGMTPEQMLSTIRLARCKFSNLNK